MNKPNFPNRSCFVCAFCSDIRLLIGENLTLVISMTKRFSLTFAHIKNTFGKNELSALTVHYYHLSIGASAKTLKCTSFENS